MHPFNITAYINFCVRSFLWKGERTMNNIQVIKSNECEKKGKEMGYKVIEINLSFQAENLYAVCTPIKTK